MAEAAVGHQPRITYDPNLPFNLPDHILKKIFTDDGILNEDDRRELSRTTRSLRIYYRFKTKYQFRYHIQGNSWKLLRKGLTNLLHKPKHKNVDWLKSAELPEVKLSKFNFNSCLDTKYRSYKSVIQGATDKDNKSCKFEPKPGPLMYVEKLTISQSILTLRSLHYLSKLFPNIKTLEIDQCGMWISPFKEPRAPWNLAKLCLSLPMVSNESGAIKKFLEFIGPLSNPICLQTKPISKKRSISRRILADFNKASQNQEAAKKKKQLKNKTSDQVKPEEPKKTEKPVKKYKMKDLKLETEETLRAELLNSSNHSEVQVHVQVQNY